jgi:hypothetical protein
MNPDTLQITASVTFLPLLDEPCESLPPPPSAVSVCTEGQTLPQPYAMLALPYVRQSDNPTEK